MKVRINQDLCQGHGMCVLACPELFRLNDDDGHACVMEHFVPQGLEDSVDQAARSCPEQAIIVTD